jgi:hypothetical protein
MPQADPSWNLVGAAAAILGGLWAMTSGLRLHRTGQIAHRSIEEIQVLNYVNLYMLLRRKPRQARLTREHVRAWGIIEFGIGCLCIVAGAIMAGMLLGVW